MRPKLIKGEHSMNRFWTSIVFVIFTFLVSQNVYAFNTYQVGEEITGREYNDVLERWFNKKFSIWVVSCQASSVG